MRIFESIWLLKKKKDKRIYAIFIHSKWMSQKKKSLPVTIRIVIVIILRLAILKLILKLIEANFKINWLFCFIYSSDSIIFQSIGEFAYVCNVKECQKHFLTSYALRIHTRTHTNEKPYECTQCKKRFNTVYRLNSHFRMHNGELFGCQSCDKQFIYRSDLKKHSRIHSGEKPYK